MEKRCLALYSGGLDSIVSIKLMQGLGIEVVPLYFATPFFGFRALYDSEGFIKGHELKYSITPNIIDYSEAFLKILVKPEHGYGRHVNPCVDCKIGMLKIAKSLLNDFHASFVITGEVLGQRPMSQRKDAMNIIERESGLKGVLVRPLCAGHMPISVPESEGIIRKEDMLDIAGRGRKRQENLALSFGILKNDIPSPAGGCLLTYAQIAEKVRETIERHSPDIPSKADFLMDVVGRKIALGEETVMIVPRDEKENDIAETLKFSGNCFLKIEDIPGPTAVIRGKSDGKILEHAAGICLRYTKERGKSGHVAMWGVAPDSLVNKVKVPVLDDDSIGKSKP